MPCSISVSIHVLLQVRDVIIQMWKCDTHKSAIIQFNLYIMILLMLYVNLTYVNLLTYTMSVLG